MLAALKRWLTGAETITTNNVIDPAEALAKLAYTKADNLAHNIERDMGKVVGASLGKLQDEAEGAFDVLNKTKAAIEAELRRLTDEYTKERDRLAVELDNTTVAAEGYAKLIDHFVVGGVSSLFDEDLTPAAKPEVPPMVHTNIATDQPAPVVDGVNDKGLPPDPLEAGQLEAAQAAREALRKTRKIFGQP